MGNQNSTETNAILQMKKLRLREVRDLPSESRWGSNLSLEGVEW